MELHNTLAESHERVLALQDELAGERGRKKAIERALKAAIKAQRGGRKPETSNPPGLFSFWFWIPMAMSDFGRLCNGHVLRLEVDQGTLNWSMPVCASYTF